MTGRRHPAPAPVPGQIVYLPVASLRHHPRNMRRFYPVEQVEQIAQSIRDYGGLVQALQVETMTVNGVAP